MLEASFFSDVIGFRLEQVIIPSWLCFKSSRPPRVHDDYYLYVYGLMAVKGVDAQLVLVSTSANVQRNVCEIVVDVEGLATTTFSNPIGVLFQMY
jgi:hypothetical protein